MLTLAPPAAVSKRDPSELAMELLMLKFPALEKVTSPPTTVESPGAVEAATVVATDVPSVKVAPPVDPSAAVIFMLSVAVDVPPVIPNAVIAMSVCAVEDNVMRLLSSPVVSVKEALTLVVAESAFIASTRFDRSFTSVMTASASKAAPAPAPVNVILNVPAELTSEIIALVADPDPSVVSVRFVPIPSFPVTRKESNPEVALCV